ncbi:MAG: YebC/PmpR family DNA-binding transcriptional regulator [bacterium]
MSGHSKWSTIKHKKAATDAKRSNVFTKLIKEITVAARLGGGDPGSNPRLRTAVNKGKENNMPADNIKRAIMKGTGELPGVSYEECTYEGYGPGGVAVLVEIMTDNKNRTLPEIRHIFSKQGGNLAETGCVSWIFEHKGLLVIDGSSTDEESLMEIVLEAGGEELEQNGNDFEVQCSPGDFESVKNALAEKEVKLLLAEITMIPGNTVKLEGRPAKQMLALMEKLEDHDDVQNVHANFDIDDSEME